MRENKDEKMVSWFIGPKGEHGKIMEDFLLDMWRDYIYWRKNYFPQDGIAFTMSDVKEIEAEIDNMQQTLIELLSKLKRNFPFYSPRYIAHMLSETTIPSVLGYFAGMIYNPNNVTPEAAPVTVELEIDAVSEILKMLGYNPPPEPPSIYDEIQIRHYESSLKKEFGWGHITPGGTLANLEALWVASLVKYSALSIKDVCIKNKIDLQVKLPNGQEEDIKKLSDFNLLTLKPNESIYLLSKLVLSIKRKFGLSPKESVAKTNKLLNESNYNLKKGIYRLLSQHPPVIFVSRSAHYSIAKSASILGIGEENVIKIDVDGMFRMDINDLEQKINDVVLNKRKIPLAVIPIAGTTEEGAVDPIHKIIDIREQFEKEKNLSFWIHIDAAWGGFLRSLLITTPKESVNIIINKLSHKSRRLNNNSITGFLNSLIDLQIDDNIKNRIQKNINDLVKILDNENYVEFLKKLKKLITKYYKEILNITEDDFSITLKDRIESVQNYVSDHLKFSYTYRYIDRDENDRTIIKTVPYEKSVNVKWRYKETISALLAFPKAESITIDPHKLGYIPYPCGMITYRNDRIRHFILQEAPYITSSKQDVLLHNPPRHWDKENNKVKIDAFGPFIIEGSRPGASATSLWFSLKSIPLNKEGYGPILKYSLLAARELYEWLNRWGIIMKSVGRDIKYEFVPLTINAPDTNIVIFSIKPKNNKLRDMNELTKKVYSMFTIQAELGDREYSYSQPFFISKTIFRHELYPFMVLENSLNKHFDLENQNVRRIVMRDYRKHGIFVLRATVMNPYIYFIKKKNGKNLIKEFIEMIDDVVNRSL